VSSRLQYRRGFQPCNPAGAGAARACREGDWRLTYPVTFSQCNKNSVLCYNPRREFRNCEIRQTPGFLPRRIRCPPKLCFLAAGRLVITSWPQPPSRTHRSPDVASSPILLNSLKPELFACQGYGRTA